LFDKKKRESPVKNTTINTSHTTTSSSKKEGSGSRFLESMKHSERLSQIKVSFLFYFLIFLFLFLFLFFFKKKFSIKFNWKFNFITVKIIVLLFFKEM